MGTPKFNQDCKIWCARCAFERTLGMGCLFPVYIRAIVKGIAVWLLLSGQKMSAAGDGWTVMTYYQAELQR
jgi:hypothetical protein